MPRSAALLRAYRETRYTAEIGRRRLELHVGRHSAAVDGALPRGASSWAYLTAWNPRSRRLSRSENDRRQRALEQLLRALGHAYYRGWGIARDEAWRERSCLVLGIARADAIAIARVFEQHAIVAGERGGPARLVQVIR